MDTPTKETKVYELIVEEIKNRISLGILKKGDKLPTERDLAEQLKLSRASIREAIRALEVIGLVECRQGAGNYIKESFEDSLFEPLSMMFILEDSNTQDILEIREALELQTVVQASKKITEGELKQLEKILVDMKGCTSEALNVQLDKKFHYTIAKASRNKIIINVLSVISQLIDELIKDSREKILADEANRVRLTKNHELIYEALRDKDTAKAYTVMREHFSLIHENI